MAYIPGKMTVSGTPGASLGQAANLASSFNQAQTGAANAANSYRAPNQNAAAARQYMTTRGTGVPQAQSGYQQHLRGLEAGQNRDPTISRRYPFPTSLDRSKYPNTIAGEYQYQQDLATGQNYAALGQTLGVYEDREARQMGELAKGEAAARAGLEYDLRNAGRQDAQNLVTSGFGGRVGERYGVTGGKVGPSRPDYSGWAPRLAEQSQSRRARELTRMEAENAARRAGVRRWGGEKLGGALSSIDAQYPDFAEFMKLQQGIGAGQTYGGGAGGNTGAGINLVGGGNTVLGRALGWRPGGGQGGGQQGGMNLKQRFNNNMRDALIAGDMGKFNQLREQGLAFGWDWKGPGKGEAPANAGGGGFWDRVGNIFG